MNDRELDMRVKETFDAVELPDAVRRRTLEACDELEGAQGDGTVPSPTVVNRGGAARRAKRAHLVTALAACLVVVVAVFGVFRVGTVPGGTDGIATPDVVVPDTDVTAFVDIDVNPSVELQLDGSNQVVRAEGVNEDGRAALAGLALEGLSYDEALSTLTSSEAFAPYLRDDAFVQVSVATDDPGQERALLDVSERRLASLPCRGSCDGVSIEFRDEAHAHGMGCGRYAAALELSALDPDVTVDDCHDMPMREIRDRIAACHGNQGTMRGQHHRHGHVS